MADKKHIKDAWECLAEKLGGLPPAQLKDLERAFYAGAYTVMGLVKAIGEAPDTTDDQGVEMLESMWQEVEQFRKEVTYDPGIN